MPMMGEWGSGGVGERGVVETIPFFYYILVPCSYRSLEYVMVLKLLTVSQ
jgi:hypothetical protein